MTYLFLDDIRYPYLNPDDYSGVDKSNIYTFVSAYHYTGFSPFKDEKWDIVRNYNEFVEFIEENGVPDFVAFDHDLGDEHYETTKVIKYDDYIEKTGYDCAKWLGEYCLDNSISYPYYYVHSMNPVGKKNIDSYIANFRKHNKNGTK